MSALTFIREFVAKSRFALGEHAVIAIAVDHKTFLQVGHDVDKMAVEPRGFDPRGKIYVDGVEIIDGPKLRAPFSGFSRELYGEMRIDK